MPLATGFPPADLIALALAKEKTTGDEGIKHPGEAWVIKEDMIEMVQE